jgi:hypothetical protein
MLPGALKILQRLFGAGERVNQVEVSAVKQLCDGAIHLCCERLWLLSSWTTGFANSRSQEMVSHLKQELHAALLKLQAADELMAQR